MRSCQRHDSSNRACLHSYKNMSTCFHYLTSRPNSQRGGSKKSHLTLAQVWENRRRLAQQCCWGAVCHSWATFQCVCRSCLAFHFGTDLSDIFILSDEVIFFPFGQRNHYAIRVFLHPFFISLSRKTSTATKSARPRDAECFPWEKMAFFHKLFIKWWKKCILHKLFS